MAQKEHGSSYRPRDDQEFLALLQKIGDMERGIEGMEAGIVQKAREYIAFKDEQSLKIKELEAIMGEMVAGLQAYAEENKKRLIDQAGKKTITMADNQFGWRPYPTAVVTDDENEAIKELVEKGYADCVQVIRRIDRKAVKDNITDFSRFKHLAIVTKEAFFIKPFQVLKKISKVGNVLQRTAPKKN
jgi:phage host-nuclease inhibitor protein Gam